MQDPSVLVAGDLFAVAILIVPGLLGLYLAAHFETAPLFFDNPLLRRLHFPEVLTQRFRYQMVGLAALLTSGPVSLVLITNGWTRFQEGIGELAEVSFFGNGLTAIVGLGLASPLFVAWAAIYIYRHPCELAKRVPGGWVTTSDVRRRAHTQPLYTVERRWSKQYQQHFKQPVPLGTYHNA